MNTRARARRLIGLSMALVVLYLVYAWGYHNGYLSSFGVTRVDRDSGYDPVFTKANPIPGQVK